MPEGHRYRDASPDRTVVMGAPRTGDSGGTVWLRTVAGVTATKTPGPTLSRAGTTRRALLVGGIGTRAQRESMTSNASSSRSRSDPRNPQATCAPTAVRTAAIATRAPSAGRRSWAASVPVRR